MKFLNISLSVIAISFILKNDLPCKLGCFGKSRKQNSKIEVTSKANEDYIKAQEVERKQLDKELLLEFSTNKLRLNYILYLLENGADPNIQNKDFRYFAPIHYIINSIINNKSNEVYLKLFKILKLILKFGADPNLSGPNQNDHQEPDMIPLFLAIKSNNLEIVELLLASGATVDFIFNSPRGSIRITKEINELLLSYFKDGSFNLPSKTKVALNILKTQTFREAIDILQNYAIEDKVDIINKIILLNGSVAEGLEYNFYNTIELILAFFKKEEEIAFCFFKLNNLFFMEYSKLSYDSFLIELYKANLTEASKVFLSRWKPTK